MTEETNAHYQSHSLTRTAFDQDSTDHC